MMDSKIITLEQGREERLTTTEAYISLLSIVGKTYLFKIAFPS